MERRLSKIVETSTVHCLRPMIKAGTWNGRDLKGRWEVTFKIDGVRCLWRGGAWVSRADKPLYNLPHYTSIPGEPTDCEAYMGSLKATLTCVRASKQDRPVPPESMYSLDPLDPRLAVMNLTNPLAPEIRHLLKAANAKGYEGLVLRQGDKWLKVKPAETLDLIVTGVEEGTGKHRGRLGFLVTSKGKVGTGFSDKERQDIWDARGLPGLEATGQLIEVEFMHLTEDGKMRHPRFIRFRFDKPVSEADG